MTNPVLHYHPLSSYSWKVLIAIDEMGIALDKQVLNLGDADERAAHLARWPLGKMPLLVDGGRRVPESSIIIEYLQRHRARPERALIPEAPDSALDVRLWDRTCDQYVMTPMGALTGDLLRPEADRDAVGVQRARAMLASSYELIDRQLQGRRWLAGEDFSMADCAAAPSLFYAFTYLPLPPACADLGRYFEQLVARPSVARVIDEARPYFQIYPGRAGLAPRFLDARAG